MLIFDDIGLVYLANPKTGTTSFEHAFAKHANLEQSRLLPKHVPFRRFKKKFPKLARNYEIVTCVRDPLETLHSWYRYRSRLTLHGNPSSTYGMTFEEFFEEWCKENPAPYADVGASVGFVLNRRGKVARKLEIFRYETSMSLNQYVAAELGLASVPRAHKNMSPKSKQGGTLPLRDRVDMSNPKIVRAYEIHDSISFVNNL